MLRRDPGQRRDCELTTTSSRPERWDLPDSFESYRSVHLRLADLAVLEHDRNLSDAHAGSNRSISQLDLESIAVGVGVEVLDCKESLSAEAFESTREVANTNSEDAACVPGTSLTDKPTRERP